MVSFAVTGILDVTPPSETPYYQKYFTPKSGSIAKTDKVEEYFVVHTCMYER